MALPRHEVAARLAALSRGLGEFPAGVACPWPLGRIFNELLKQARQELPEDPIIKGIRYVQEVSGDNEPGGSTAASGTVRALIEQIAVALDDKPASPPTAPKASQPRRRPKDPASDRV